MEKPRTDLEFAIVSYKQSDAWGNIGTHSQAFYSPRKQVVAVIYGNL